MVSPRRRGLCLVLSKNPFYFFFAFSCSFKNIFSKFQVDLSKILEAIEQLVSTSSNCSSTASKTWNAFFPKPLFQSPRSYHLKTTCPIRFKFCIRSVVHFFYFGVWGFFTYKMAEYFVENSTFHIKWSPKMLNKEKMKLLREGFISTLTKFECFCFQIIFSLGGSGKSPVIGSFVNILASKFYRIFLRAIMYKKFR